MPVSEASSSGMVDDGCDHAAEVEGQEPSVQLFLAFQDEVLALQDQIEYQAQ